MLKKMNGGVSLFARRDFSRTLPCSACDTTLSLLNREREGKKKGEVSELKREGGVFSFFFS